MSSIFTVHRQPYGEVMNPISPDSVRFHDKNGNVTEVRMVDGMVNIHVGGVTVSAEHLEDLIRQMFGRGEHPPAEAHCATCDCVPGMTPAIRFDTTPAEREGEVRDHLIRMGWTPPAEAQAQGGGEVELRHMVAKLAAHVRPTCGELWAEAERLLNRTAPPSAPVGVDTIRDGRAIVDEFLQCASIGRPHGKLIAQAKDWLADAEAALTKQPAAEVYVDFPQVGTAGPFAVVDGKVTLPDTTMNDLIRHARTGYVKQPAAVDGLLTCYQCGKTVTWLAPDSRCGDCTRLTPDEVRG